MTATPGPTVVVGNGMAGIRAIEEILARGAARRSERSTSPCSATSPTATTTASCCRMCLPAAMIRPRSTSTRWTGTPTTASTCGPGCASFGSTRSRTWCTPTTAPRMRYDKLILATGSRSFFPPMDGLWADDKTLADGVFGFRTLDDTRGDDRRGRQPHQGRRDRRRPARPGSRARAAEPRAGRRRRARRPDADERPTRRPRRRDPAQVGGEPRHRRAHREAHHRGDRRPTARLAGHRVRRRRRGSTATCW